MARSTFRVLKRKGRVVLIEAANPGIGVGYSVRVGSFGVWNGLDLTEAERQFDEAAKEARKIDA
jgi:hypothetical protein